MTRRVVVTGDGGFIGQHLVTYGPKGGEVLGLVFNDADSDGYRGYHYYGYAGAARARANRAGGGSFPARSACPHRRPLFPILRAKRGPPSGARLSQDAVVPAILSREAT